MFKRLFVREGELNEEAMEKYLDEVIENGYNSDDGIEVSNLDDIEYSDLENNADDENVCTDKNDNKIGDSGENSTCVQHVEFIPSGSAEPMAEPVDNDLGVE